MANCQASWITPISIHAPRVGSDLPGYIVCNKPHIISIHAPRVGSDPRISRNSASVRISIHAPRVGSDGMTFQDISTVLTISIHAPRVGSDLLYPNLSLTFQK